MRNGKWKLWILRCLAVLLGCALAELTFAVEAVPVMPRSTAVGRSVLAAETQTGTGAVVRSDSPALTGETNVEELTINDRVLLQNGVGGVLKTADTGEMVGAVPGSDYVYPSPVIRHDVSTGAMVPGSIVDVTDAAACGTALAAAVAAAADGDVILLGPYTFNLGTATLDLSVGGTGTVHLRGSGMGVTIVTKNNNTAILRPGPGQTIADVQFGVDIATDIRTMSVAAVSSTLANTRWERVRCYGLLDNIQSANVTGHNVFRACEFNSSYDSFLSNSGAGSVDFVDCAFELDGQNRVSDDELRAIMHSGSGRIRLIGCRIRTHNAGLGEENNAIYNVGAGTVEVYASRVEATGTGNLAALRNVTGTFSVDAATFYSSSDGTITTLPAWGVTPSATTLGALDENAAGWRNAISAQASDAELTAVAGLTSAADRLAYYTGSGAAALATYTPAARALDDDTTTAEQRATLGTGCVISGSAQVFDATPTDATAYMGVGGALGFGSFAENQTRTIIATRSGTIKRCYVRVWATGTQGSAETSAISLRVNGSNTTITNSFKTSTPGGEMFSNTAMNVAVAAGDTIALHWLTPTWATNPSGVYLNYSFEIE